MGRTARAFHMTGVVQRGAHRSPGFPLSRQMDLVLSDFSGHVHKGAKGSACSQDEVCSLEG